MTEREIVKMDGKQRKHKERQRDIVALYVPQSYACDSLSTKTQRNISARHRGDIHTMNGASWFIATDTEKEHLFLRDACLSHNLTTVLEWFNLGFRDV